MKSFILKHHSILPQEKIFEISTDVKNFHNIMPDYFKSLVIVEENNDSKIVIEKINYLGISFKIKTKHIIITPNIHEVHILSGPTKGTSFIESYTSDVNGSLITICVNLKFNGFLRFFNFLQEFIAKKMNRTMNEFVVLSEKYAMQQRI